MGYWTILIRGVGPHHNKNKTLDADYHARELIEDLKAAGQRIHVATFQVDDVNHHPAQSIPLESLEK